MVAFFWFIARFLALYYSSRPFGGVCGCWIVCSIAFIHFCSPFALRTVRASLPPSLRAVAPLNAIYSSYLLFLPWTYGIVGSLRNFRHKMKRSFPLIRMKSTQKAPD